MKCVTELGRASGKVNLHLNVFGKRPDGYHEIISIFQKVSLADELMLKISYDDPSIQEPEVLVKGLEGIAEPGKDTMTRAVRFWCRRFSIPVKAEIVINKRIPAKSGMGGGSSDAALVLLVLNHIFQQKVDKQFLTDCAMGVGADVPFFISGGHAAVVEGVGDVLTPIVPKNLFGYVLMPKTVSDTANAYAELDRKGLCTRVLDRAELMKMYAGPISSWRFANDFSRVVLPPAVNVPRNCFYSLTGSGSAGLMLNSVYPPFAAEFEGVSIPVLLL